MCVGTLHANTAVQVTVCVHKLAHIAGMYVHSYVATGYLKAGLELSCWIIAPEEISLSLILPLLFYRKAL